jgi:transcriptional regulator with XRE-family HTH domain
LNWIDKSISEIPNNGDIDTDKILDIRKIIKDACKDKKISYKKLCENLCFTSQFSDFLSYKKSINNLTLDLIMQRIGMSGGDFDKYITPNEYEIFKIRNKIINYIEIRKIEEAESEITKFISTVGEEDNIHRRFILLMKAWIAQLNNKSNREIYLKLKKAVEITIPNFEISDTLDGHVLGYNELFFLIECIKFREKMYADNQKNDKISQRIYHKVMKYIEENYFDDNIRAMLYSKLVCLLVRNDNLNNNLDDMLEKYDRAMFYLQKSSKLYYIKDIMWNMCLVLKERIASLDNKIKLFEEDVEIVNSYKKKYLKNEKQRQHICEILDKVNLSDEPFEVYPLNFSGEQYPIGKIIKTRREMFNMSKVKLSMLTGMTDRTIARIEDGETNPYHYSIKKVFQALGMVGEFQSYAFDCNSYAAYKIGCKLLQLVTSGKYKEANKALKEFEKNIDPSTKLNKQYLGYIETVISHSLGDMTDEEAIEKFTEALNFTISEEEVFSNTRKHFTKNEIKLIYNIGLIQKVNEKNEKAMKWLGIFENYYNDIQSAFDISTYISTYEMTMSLYASLLGNMMQFDKSDEIAEKVLYESLKCRRGGFVGRLLSNNAYNMKKRIEASGRKMQPQEIKEYKDKLKKALSLSCLMGDDEMKEYLENKLI